MFRDLKNTKIRFFLLQSGDPGMILFKEFYFWYLLNLLIERLDFLLSNIYVEIIYPFNKYVEKLYSRLSVFEEEYFVFYLENAYHSNGYALAFVLEVLEKIKNFEKKPKIILYSLKLTEKEAIEIMGKYDFVKLVIRTDIEYFFNEYFYKNNDIAEVKNIIFRNQDENIIVTEKESVDYDLWEYLLWWYYTWYLNRYHVWKDQIIQYLDDDQENIIDKDAPHVWTKDRIIESFRYSPETIAMLSTGRGCKYKCSYCYRWVKYSKVRQVPLEVIKKDLDYLKEMYYEDVYLYDDCFLTTNYNRLEEIISLLASYDFHYGISVRYEMCQPKVFELLSKLKLYRVQIWLQSISRQANSESRRAFNKDKFTQLVQKFKDNWVIVSIDLILWLPGEWVKEFIKSFNYALSLSPGRIHINPLFFNPGTELSNNIEKYGIKMKNVDSWLFSVPVIESSTSFSKQDIALARKYVQTVMKKVKNTVIMLRWE